MTSTHLRGRALGSVVALVLLCACGDGTHRQEGGRATAAVVAPSPGPARVVVATLEPTAAWLPSPTATSAPVEVAATSARVEIVVTGAPAEVVATGAPVAAVTEGPADGERAREERLIAEVNALRGEHGLAGYVAEPALADVARAHSCDLAAHSVISHTSSDGRTLRERLGTGAERWAWPSESIAAGTDHPAEVIALWMDEPPDGWHRRNLLDPDQQVVGVGYCVAPDDPSGNRHYWTMIVARSAR